MKKALIVFAAILILLCGCQVKENTSAADYGDDISKAQEIAVISPDTSEVIAVITDTKEIKDFVLALDLDQWKLKALPDGAAAIGSFGFAKEETVKLGQAGTDGALYEIAAITLYEGNHIRFEIGGFDMTFEVGKDTADFLSGYFK